MYIKRMLAGGFLGGALVLGAALVAGAKAEVAQPGCTAPTAGQAENSGMATAGTSANATVSECVTISVPGVVALHLHETSWTLNLANLGSTETPGQTQCYRAGNHDSATGRDVLYDISGALEGATWSGDGVADANNPYSFVGTAPTFGGTDGAKMLPVNSYPGYVADEAGNVLWKGPIVCFNRKIVEKFSNSANGWTFTAGLGNATSGFPDMLIGDIVAGSTSATFATLKTSDTSAHTLATGTGSTGGWLDDYILEGVLFNGSEQAGTQSANVVFQLTSNF